MNLYTVLVLKKEAASMLMYSIGKKLSLLLEIPKRDGNSRLQLERLHVSKAAQIAFRLWKTVFDVLGIILEEC